ncbi:hypothetical protein ABPG74_022412 [Tetrahymena malaccensis]
MMQENEAFEEALFRIFQDDTKINKILQDLEDLNAIDSEDISVQITEIGVGLKIELKISAGCLKQHGIEFKRFKNDIFVDLVLTPDYPYDNPRIFFQNTFCYPSLADGRNFFNSVMSHIKWNSSLMLTQVLNEIINYIKILNRRIKDYEFLVKEGQYEIGEEYDMEYFLNLSTCELFASQEIISKKKLNQKILMITQFKFLEFELIKNSNKTAQLVKVEDLSELISFGYAQKSKDRRIQLKWQIKDKKKTRQVEFLIDEEEKFLKLIEERVSQVEKLMIATKKVISEDEVTLKSYENMDLDQILQNITIIESELSENITLSAIDTLMVLYQKAIEFLSAVADPSYKLFIQKLQDLLTREDVQIILKSKEKPQSSEIKQEQKPGQQIAIEDFDSIFEDLSQSHVQKNDEQGKVSEDEQKKRKMEELKKAELLKKYFQHRINLQNSERYIHIQTRFFSKYIEKLYYDKTDKKKVVHIQYKNHNRADFDNEILVRQLLITQKENLIPGILEINKSSKEIIYTTGLCNLSQLAEVYKNKQIDWQKQDLLYILKTLLLKLQEINEMKIFLSEIKPENIVTFPKENFRDYGIEFSINQQNLCDGANYPLTYSRAYTEPQFLKHLQNKEPIADHEKIQNELYMIGRTIQYLIDSNQENFKHENVANFVNNLSEEKYGSALKKILQMLLIEKVVNDFGYILSELNRGEQNIDNFLKDENGFNLVIHENIIKQGLQNSLILDIHQKVLFEQRYQLNERVNYMIDTIGSDNYPLFPLLAHEKQGSLKDILEKTENLIKENQEYTKETKRLYDSIIQILQTQQIKDLEDSFNFPETNLISNQEQFIFINLLCLKGIIYKWNGYIKLFKRIQEYALDACQKLIGQEHPIYANCLINLAQAESLNSHPEKGVQYLIQCYIIRKKLLGNHPSTIYTLLSIAETLRKQGRFNQSLEIHERVQHDFTELSEKDQNSICLGKLLLSQAKTLMLSKKINESYSLISQAVEIFKETYGEESIQISEAYAETADLFTLKQQLKDAHQLNLQCIQIVKNLYGDNHPLLADYYVNISYTFRNAKNFDESMNFLIQAMEIRKKFFGDSHPIIADTYTEQANSLTYSNQLQQAAELHKIALKIRQELYGIENSTTLSSLEAIVVLLLVQQKFEEASEYQSKVIDGYDLIYGPDSIQLAQFLEKVAYQHEQLKNYSEALPYQQRVIEIRQKNIDSDQNHQYLQSLLNISFSLDQSNQFEESLKYKNEALKRMKTELGEKHKKVTQQLISIAETQINLDQSQNALENLKEALIQIQEQGLKENDTTKCLRTMGQILFQQGQKGNTEVVFEYYEKILNVVKEVLTQQSPYYQFIESICSQMVEQLIQ